MFRATPPQQATGFTKPSQWLPPPRLARSIAVGLSLSLALLSRIAAAAPEIEYGYPDQSIFVAKIDAQGRVDSPTLRLAGALLDRLGTPWHATAYPAPRLFRNLKDGTTNFSILVRSAALESCCVVSKAPVLGTTLNVYSLGDVPTITRREQLAGHSVITIRGYTYSGLLAFIDDPANRIRNEVAATHQAAFDMLAARRAEYVIDYGSAAGDYLAAHPLAGVRSDVLEKVEAYLVLSRSYPGAEQLMPRLEAIARTINTERVPRERRTR